MVGVLLIGFSFAQNLSIELYVNNMVYTKPVFTNKNVLYVAVDDVLPILGIQVTHQGRILCGANEGYTGPACPESKSPALLFLDGKPIMQGVLIHREKAWISVPLLGKALGYVYEYNSSTGIADLISPALVTRAKYAPDVPSDKSKSDEKKKSGASKGKDDVTALVQAPESDILSTQDPNTYEVRTNYTLVNNTDHPVEGVTAILNYMDGYGQPLVTHSFNIGTMGAKATVTQEDYWINYTSVYSPKVNVEVDWEGKKKE